MFLFKLLPLEAAVKTIEYLISYLVLSRVLRVAALLGARFRSADTSLNVDDGLEGNGPLDIPAGCNMGRRRSRAVLYQLSGHYVSVNVPLFTRSLVRVAPLNNPRLNFFLKVSKLKPNILTFSFSFLP